MPWLVHLAPDPGRVPVDPVTGLVDGLALRRALLPLAPGGRLLFRWEAGSDLLVQTPERPALTASRLPAAVLAGPRELTGWAPGTLVRYRIAANATRRNGAGSAVVRRDRLTVLRGTAATEWWQVRALAAGFRPVSAAAVALPDLLGAHGLRHGVTRFDGTAEVSDPALLRTAVTEGIGRARNYGCGLLTVDVLSPE